MKPSSAGSTGVSESRSRVAFEPSNSVADYDALLTSVPTIDDVLDGHASALGNDFVAYRNHVYRVANLCVAIAGGRGDLEKIAAAAVFHDLGIWTDRTFDYIAPSIALAREYLVAREREDWISEISTMIADHHKITPSMANPNSLVENRSRVCAAGELLVARRAAESGEDRTNGAIVSEVVRRTRHRLVPGRSDAHVEAQAQAQEIKH
jgi:hypothetical protein